METVLYHYVVHLLTGLMTEMTINRTVWSALQERTSCRTNQSFQERESSGKGVLTKITQYHSWKLQKLYVNALTFHVFATGAVYNGMDSLSDNVFHFVARRSRLYLYQSGRIYGNNSTHSTK